MGQDGKTLSAEKRQLAPDLLTKKPPCPALPGHGGFFMSAPLAALALPWRRWRLTAGRQDAVNQLERLRALGGGHFGEQIRDLLAEVGIGRVVWAMCANGGGVWLVAGAHDHHSYQA